jgi:tetratricopeptide (TPR) repeat protein
MIVLSASILLLSSTFAHAQPNGNGCTGVRQAKAQFELGQAHIKLGNYELAMMDFEAGYACIPLPLFLYDIAQMARLSGQRAKALEYYKRYLDAEPTARERPYVVKWIAALSQHNHAKDPKAQPPDPAPAKTSAPTTSPMVIAPTLTAAPATPAATAPAPAPATLTSTDLVRRSSPASAPAPEHSSHRGAWIALGVVGGALVVAGAVTLGVLLGTRSSSSAVPSGFHDLGGIDSFAH